MNKWMKGKEERKGMVLGSRLEMGIGRKDSGGGWQMNHRIRGGGGGSEKGPELS
jgi:hypothetical protein